jgi:hypothetical protein
MIGLTESTFVKGNRVQSADEVVPGVADDAELSFNDASLSFVCFGLLLHDVRKSKTTIMYEQTGNFIYQYFVRNSKIIQPIMSEW